MKSLILIISIVFILFTFSFNVSADLMSSSNYNLSAATISSGGTNTSSANYQNNLVLGDLIGNINSLNYKTYVGFFQTIKNNPPSITNVEITPASPSSSQDLTCTATGWSDDDGDSEDYYYEWRKNTVLQSTIHSSSSTNVLGYGNTTINDAWNCTVTPYDGYENGTSKSDEVSVGNTAPEKPILLIPTNDNNTLFSRYPSFTWNSTDYDGDELNFSLEVNISDSGDVDRLYSLNDSLYSQNGNDYNYTIPDELNVYVENNNHPYEWRVRAYDGEDYSEWSDIYNFSIEETVIVNSINLNVDFGGPLDPEAINDTDTLGNPFVFKNVGNVNISLRNLTMSENFWLSEGLGNDSLQYKADDYFDGGDNSTYNESGSITSWTNFSLNNPNVVRNLYYGSGLNYIEVDLRIEVPWKEPPGSRSRNMTFFWQIDDVYGYSE